MENNKPLIFVYPLSDTLQKLKEVIAETAEEESIEIYDVDQLMEINQLVPTIGQSLIICGTPKKCAMLMQANRKPLAKLNSKVLLLNQSNIPHRVLDKLSKIGLTEFIKEPVNPKTLLYKVKLLLRSIKSQKEEAELKQKSLAGAEAQEEEYEEVDRASMFEADGNDNAEEESFYKGKTKKETETEEVEAPRKSNYKEERISGQMRGSIATKDNFVENDDSPANLGSQKADHLSKHYKGSVSSDEQEEDNDEKDKSAKLSMDEDLDIDSLKQELNNEIKDELARDKNKAIGDLVEKEEEKKRHASVREEHDKYLKGKMGSLSAEENEKELKQNQAPLLEESAKDKKPLDLPKEFEEEEEKESRAKLQLTEAEEKEKDILQKPGEEKEEREIRQKMQLDVGEEEPRERQAYDNTINDRLGNEGDHSADRLQTHYKGHTSHQKEEDENKKKLTPNMQINDTAKEEKDKLALGDEKDLDYERPKAKLDLEKTPDEKDLYAKSPEEELERERSKSLDLEKTAKGKKDPLQKEEDEDSPYQPRKKLNIEEQDADPYTRNAREEAKKKKAGIYDGYEPESVPLNNRADARSDKIATHYSSKSSHKHNDQEWGSTERETLSPDFGDFPKKKDENPIFAEPEHLGEQTIDYRKLKAEFEGFDYEIPGKKEETGFSGGSEQLQGASFSYDGGPPTEQDIFPQAAEGEEEEENIESGEVFEATPNGLDTVIQMLSLYYDRSLKQDHFFKFVADKIQTEDGETTFFMLDTNSKEFTERYSVQASSSAQTEKNWEEVKKNNFSYWEEMSLPTWSDSTFQEENIEFFYPYFEGINNMGFAVVHFHNGFSKEKTKTIEIMLESVRAVYLTNFHGSEFKGDYKAIDQGEAEQKNAEEPQKKGLFGKLFGKKAG